MTHLPWGQAEALGSEWALTLRTELDHENRSVCGGWPGTLSEARARVALIVSAACVVPGRTTVTIPELEIIASALYASARTAWRKYAQPEKPIGA